MIVDASELLAMPEFSSYAEATLARKLKSIESLIRAYTNNNFQNRQIRFEAATSTSELLTYNPYLKVGDTIQITESINEGLYVVTAIDRELREITLDEGVFEADKNLITKVVYPPSIVEGVITLMKWEVNNKQKIGIQSETLSRHSVTYFNVDGDNSLLGYPKSLLGFLKPYVKARF